RKSTKRYASSPRSPIPCPPGSEVGCSRSPLARGQRRWLDGGGGVCSGTRCCTSPDQPWQHVARQRGARACLSDGEATMAVTTTAAGALARHLEPAALKRFLRYARVDTQAREVRLGRRLVQELQALGLRDAQQDAHGIVTATLPATVDGAPTIGLLAHLDTSP